MGRTFLLFALIAKAFRTLWGRPCQGDLLRGNRAGGCSEILGDCGRIAPPAEPASLAQCWLELLSLPESEFRKEGLKARQRIKECFSADKFVDSYFRIFSFCKN